MKIVVSITKPFLDTNLFSPLKIMSVDENYYPFLFSIFYCFSLFIL